MSLYEIQIAGTGKPVSFEVLANRSERISDFGVEGIPVQVPGSLGMKIRYAPLAREVHDVRQDISMKRIQIVDRRRKDFLPVCEHG